MESLYTYSISKLGFKKGKLAYCIDNNCEKVTANIYNTCLEIFIKKENDRKNILYVSREGGNIKKNTNILIATNQIRFADETSMYCQDLPYIFWEMILNLTNLMKNEITYAVAQIPVFDDSLNNINLYMVKKISNIEFALITPIIAKLRFSAQGVLEEYNSVDGDSIQLL